MRIIGPPSAPLPVVLANIPTLKPDPRFAAEMVGPLWDAAVRYTVDPVPVVAQAFKETGGGRFGGKVRPEFFNPCGLKNRTSLFPGVDDDDQPLAHARFASWQVGAEAQVQHIRAYCGFPVTGVLIVDPRYDLVLGQRCETFEELGGRWAPSLTYGTELVAIAAKLRGTA